MSPILILATLVVITQARPEAGYNYPIPNSGINVGGLSLNGLGSNSVETGFSSGSSTSSLFSSGSHGVGGIGGIGGIGLSTGGFSTNNFGGQFGGNTLIQKHIYVHVPPPEQEEEFTAQSQILQQPQKHYKIIFIKTPSPPSPTQSALNVIQAQNQEKTLIYVLVKKPEDQPDIQVPPVLATPPSKPEVYFIRYKSKKGIDGGIGVSGIGGGPGVISNAVSLGSSTNGISLGSSSNGISLGSSGNGLLTGSSISSSSLSTSSIPSGGYGPPGLSGPY